MEKKKVCQVRKPGAGRKRKKPDYNAAELLKEQMEAVASLYDSGTSLQGIADELHLNPIKVRKLLIIAGVYESDVADRVQQTFQKWKERQSYKNALRAIAADLKLSRSSATSYLPYEKGLYFSEKESAEKISVGAERQRRYRAVKKWRSNPTEENLWNVIFMYEKFRFKTYSGVPFFYEIRKNQYGEYTKELWVNCGGEIRCLSWGKVLRAFRDLRKMKEIADGSAQLENDLDMTYSYGIFTRFDNLTV